MAALTLGAWPSEGFHSNSAVSTLLLLFQPGKAARNLLCLEDQMRKSSAHARAHHPLHAEALVDPMTAMVLAALVVAVRAKQILDQ